MQIINNKYITFFAASASVIVAVIALMEWRKKSKQYDLNEQKTELDIEKARLEISQLKTNHF